MWGVYSLLWDTVYRSNLKKIEYHEKVQFPSEGNFYATSSRGRYGNASSVTGYLKHD